VTINGTTETITYTRTTVNIVVFTPPSSSTQLTSGVWSNGSITGSVSSRAYSFNVTSGTKYYVWWEDEYSGNRYGTLDIEVRAYYANGTFIFGGDDVEDDYPESFTATSSGTVYLIVKPLSYGETGTFSIVYSTNSSRPSFSLEKVRAGSNVLASRKDAKAGRIVR